MPRCLMGILLMVVLVACGDNDVQDKVASGRVPRMGVLYKATAEEGDSVVTVVAQFYNGEDGAANMALPQSSSVMLDGTALRQDSAGLQGVFYESQLPLETFGGSHQLKLQYEDGRSYADSFAFYPFTIATLPSTIPVEDVSIKLEGLPDGSVVRMVLTDTAFDSNGINELDTVQDGSVLLPARWLKTLSAGPVVMHLFAENDRPLRSGLRGELSVSYGLNRTFTLQKK